MANAIPSLATFTVRSFTPAQKFCCWVATVVVRARCNERSAQRAAMPSPDKKVAVVEPPEFDPYAAEAAAVLVAKSALSAAKDELRSLEHRTQVLLAPPEEPFKPGAAPPAKGAKPGAAPPVDPAHEAQVAEAQAAVADAKQRVQACKEEHAAAEGTLRRRRLVQLAEKLQEETDAQKAAFREALRGTSAELTEEVRVRARARARVG